MIYEKQKRYIIPFDDVPTPRAEMPEISVDERRGNFTEVETGFPEDVAVNEAKRCLSCRRCLGCALCWAECGPEAIDFSMPDEELDLEFDDVVITKGQDNAFHPVAPELGYGTYADVITDLQFERMLSPTGPTDGLVVSPLNGDIPKRLGIVQAHPEAGDDHLLSSVVLGVNEAILALDGTDELTVSLISPLCAPFKEAFQGESEKITGLTLIDGIPESVQRSEEGDPLTLSYSQNGEASTESFDMIVLLTKPMLSPEVQSLSKKLEKPIP
ncbi:MAG: hypothetical protein P8165_04590 [Deltaproteobacteria bacterium]|jgi:heterodisulfide reductase subunit A-like polyferredoxin